MKFRKNIWMLSVALVMGLVLTACGNDASADRTSSAGESAVEAEDGGASLSEETGMTGAENAQAAASGTENEETEAEKTENADADTTGTGSADAGAAGAGADADAGAGSGEKEAAGAANEGTAGTEDAPEANGSILVAYFSHTGNTREVAELIAGYTGGDLAEIKRAEEYGDLQEEAEVEIQDGVHPEITVSVSNVTDYETIFVGYPIWWDEAPAMIATFLAENDFSGKTIVPFCTSASDDIGNSLYIFSELCPDAEIAEGLTANNLDDIEPWIQGLGILE